jgi:transmembrane sensor
MADARCHQRTRGYPAPSPAIWKRRSVLGGLVAASGAAVLASRFMMARGQAYVTQLGEIRRVPLGDGSVMTINSDTELKVHLAKHMRQIELAQGEAWFEVAKDAARPFVVASGNARPRGGHRFLGSQT